MLCYILIHIIYPIFSQIKNEAFIFDLSKLVEYLVLNAFADIFQSVIVLMILSN